MRMFGSAVVVHVVMGLPVCVAQVPRGPVLELGRAVGGYGVESGDINAEMGGIRDLAIDEVGRMFLLDPRLGRIRVVDSKGRLVTVAGRPGAGPGELRDPASLAYDPQTKRLYVLDPGLGRIGVFVWAGDSLKYSSSIPTPPLATDLCAMRGLLYLYSPGMDNSPVIRVLTGEGKEVLQFGEGFGAEGGPMLRMAKGGGVLACFPEAGLVVLAGAVEPSVVAYRTDGGLQWRTRLVNYIEPKIQILAGGWRIDPSTPQPWDMIDRVVGITDTLLAVEFERRERPPQTRGGAEARQRFTAFLLAGSGRELSRQSGLPPLSSVGGQFVYSASDDPFPRVTVMEYRIVTRR